ncbi:MAG: type II secretion system F family protein [Candidatus Saccharimonadales bacterium]
MAEYTYTAVTKDGKSISGSIEASSKDTLIETLHKQGLRPLVVKQKSSRGNISFGKPKVKLKDMVMFTRQLSTMVSAGVPLTRSLTTLQEQTENKYFKTVIGSITKDVESGITIGDAMAKFPNVFSEVYVNMVKAGEAGGILDEILKRLASQVEQEASMKKKIKSAMTYPVVIGTIAVLAFFGLMIFVMPKMGKIIKDLGGPDAKLPVYSQFLLDMSGYMQKYAVFIIIALGVAIYFTRRYIRTPKGKFQFHLLMLRTPIIKEILIKIAVARFARTFASLMSAGVSVLDALQVTGGAIGNKVLQKELDEAAKEVKNGKPLSEPMAQSKYFPPIVSQMLAIGEETGQIDTILVKIADFYEEEVSTTIDGLSSIIEPVMIIAIGAMVGVIAASVMGPISSLSKNIGSN